ncbi:MAG: IMPACT family protein [Flavisolibacter sp.]
MDHYYTIEKPSVAEFKDRGSRFIAYAYPLQNVEAFKKYLKALKEEHHKAVHHCFAYRLGMDKNQFRSSDDGEPSGSAGKPILGQIDSKELTNTAIIVVRYFGGTLLGVPGLINAYKTAASYALQLTPIIEKPVVINYELHFDYTIVNDVMMAIKRFNCFVIENEAQLFCRMVIGIPKKNAESCISKLKDMHGLEIKAVNP